jgi:hypothetical protein
LFVLLTILQQVFKSTTQKFSSNTTNLPEVIPAMDHMHATLKASIDDESIDLSIRAALSLGVQLLNKYYSLTDESEVYRIAISKSFVISTLEIQLLLTYCHSTSPELQAQVFQEGRVG